MYRLHADFRLHAIPQTRAVSDFLGEIYEDAYKRAVDRPGDIWNALFQASATPELREVFAIARNEPTPYVLPLNVVFPNDLYPMQFRLTGRGADYTITIDEADALRELKDVFCGEPDNLEAEECVEAFIHDAVLVKPPVIRTFERPGIYRGHHACLIFRSEKSTVVTDPVAGAIDRPIAEMLPTSFSDVDGILISHSHEDHFSLPTLMQFPRQTRIVVPKVEAASMLCRNMGAELRAAGFTNVVEADWYSSVRINDITVHVYPFYGEQPWITFGSPDPRLRNQGNTYLVTADDVKTWCLFDSGVEYGRAMADLVPRILAEHGHVDIVTSNLERFDWRPGQIDNSGRFWFCFPEEILQHPDRWPNDALITFGVEGMQALLSKIGPSLFLPYAHWWHDPGTAIEVRSERCSEAEVSRRIEFAVPNTRCPSWTVGDRLDTRRRDGAVYSQDSVCKSR